MSEDLFVGLPPPRCRRLLMLAWNADHFAACFAASGELSRALIDIKLNRSDFRPFSVFRYTLILAGSMRNKLERGGGHTQWCLSPLE
jgi:hypothetical protein